VAFFIWLNWCNLLGLTNKHSIMKKSVLLLFITVILTSCFTTKMVTLSDTPFIKVYDDIIGTQNELFLKSNEWMVGAFNSAKSVIQHSDKAEGVIIGKYLMLTTPNTVVFGSSTPLPGTDVYAIIDIRVKDNKARIEIKPNDFKYFSDGMSKAITKEDVLLIIDGLAESFHKTLKTKKVDF
jgi:hypothetical protein